GAEVVQCYVETLCAPVVRPDRELIRFRKIFLLPGEEQEVKFTVNRKELAFYGENMELIDGDVQFRFIVGNSSRSEAGSILYAF
ncbi:MAG: fibronectin type III-like domain-contianing protein, partial [Roseburia faecis]|nr:fibronectin type III-like domain-contianing protein [Roseburia faecis]